MVNFVNEMTTMCASIFSGTAVCFSKTVHSHLPKVSLVRTLLHPTISLSHQILLFSEERYK